MLVCYRVRAHSCGGLALPFVDTVMAGADDGALLQAVAEHTSDSDAGTEEAAASSGGFQFDFVFKRRSCQAYTKGSHKYVLPALCFYSNPDYRSMHCKKKR